LIYITYQTDGLITGKYNSPPPEFMDSISIDVDVANIEQTHMVVDGQLVEREFLYQPDIHPTIKRLKEYDINKQLNLLVDDINAGLFGEAAKTGRFMNYIMDIKNRHPK